MSKTKIEAQSIVDVVHLPEKFQAIWQEIYKDSEEDFFLVMLHEGNVHVFDMGSRGLTFRFKRSSFPMYPDVWSLSKATYEITDAAIVYTLRPKMIDSGDESWLAPLAEELAEIAKRNYRVSDDAIYEEEREYE